MRKYDWMQAIKTNILILKIVGLWPKDDESYKFDFYTFYASIWLSTLLVASTFFQGINIIFILGDVKALTGTAYVLLTEILAVIKTYFIVKNMKMLKRLMKSLNNNKLFQPRNVEQIELVQTSLKFWKLTYNVIHSMVGGANLFWILFPMVDKKEKRLPFLGWYIVDTKVSPYYEIVYGFQFCSCFYMSALIINIDTLIAALNVYVGTQIDLLCNNVRNLKPSSVEQELITCIKHHQEILR
ncbi:odorant receptor Or1-like [Tribolium madens]|uniref:odorant receptor Or1-like n=1 Tax=Tribolium madens TaxID=41895 RepID=UPI001CF761B2|nr:odorant receptor Or1-like [Tribolium madens]